MPMLCGVLIDAADPLAQLLFQDDHQVHHGGIGHLQPFPNSSEDRPFIPLLPSPECTADYEDRHEVTTKDITRSKLHTVEIQ